jgi:hypothetical protein
MNQVNDTGDAFKVKHNWSLDDYLATAIDGHQSTGPTHHVVLRFDADIANLGEESIWNKTQKISKDEQGRVIVEFDTAALYAVERQVLGWGGRVAALGPVDLCQLIKVSISRLASSGKV